jgi:hypothetical protein
MRARRRLFATLLATGLAAVAPSFARADEPSAERIRSAADEFDMGRRAFLANDFEQAAIHFENAYRDAPRAEALRNAIRARRSAKQYARAATLASLAGIRYGNDATTMAMVNETLASLSPQLQGVNLGCEPECSVTADGRVVSIDDAKQISIYLLPGKHDLVVSWSGDRSRRMKIEGAAGTVKDLDLVAPPLPTPKVATTITQPPAPARTSTADARPDSRKPFGPVVFIAGAVVTAGGLAATIASGLAAQSDPGTDAVKRDCVGLGESCPTYQRGKDAEVRTNILLGATAGAFAATAVIGIFFTQWSRPSPSTARVVPFVTERAIGVTGRF